MINKSAEKRERQNAVRRMRNRAAKSTMRKAIKKFDTAVMAGDTESASAALDLSLKLLDSTAGKGVIHSRTADRKKSRMHARFNKLNAQTSVQA